MKPSPQDLLDRHAVESIIGCGRETVRARAAALGIVGVKSYGRVLFTRLEAEQMAALRPLDRVDGKVTRGRPRTKRGKP